MGTAPKTLLSESLDDHDYAARLRQDMRRLWRNVIRRRAPHVAELIEQSGLDLPPGEEAIPSLQAINIWFQLTKIIDENTAMRDRRQAEARNGAEAVEGSFARAFAEIDPQMTPEAFEAMAGRLSVGPTLTAHPTEAKRVTILEIHRRIYRLLVTLETHRWTPREREDFLLDIESEIDLLWMTGELRLERPSLKDEIEWGLQFFRDSVYDAIPQLFERFQTGVKARFGTDLEITPCVRFHSWIGGDRDGNPNVTAEVTRDAIRRSRLAILEKYIGAVRAAAARISITSRIVTIPAPDQQRIRAIIAETGEAEHYEDRNPGELFRQALTAVTERLHATIDGGTHAYVTVGQFVADLRTLDDALVGIGAGRIAERHLRPIRWQAQTFGFRTATLDVRQNSTVTTAVIAEIWGLGGAAPAYGTQGLVGPPAQGTRATRSGVR